MDKDEMKFSEESLSDGCCGWRYPKECPYDGKFDESSLICQECVQDALDAMNKQIKEV